MKSRRGRQLVKHEEMMKLKAVEMERDGSGIERD